MKKMICVVFALFMMLGCSKENKFRTNVINYNTSVTTYYQSGTDQFLLGYYFGDDSTRGRVVDFSFSSSKIDTGNFSAVYGVERGYVIVYLQENGKNAEDDKGHWKTCWVDSTTYLPDKIDQNSPYCTAEAIGVAKKVVKHHDEVLKELNMTDDDIYQMLWELAEKEAKK